jgi:ABC-type antimicrobial peptide transport system ATPase subunit
MVKSGPVTLSLPIRQIEYLKSLPESASYIIRNLLGKLVDGAAEIRRIQEIDLGEQLNRVSIRLEYGELQFLDENYSDRSSVVRALVGMLMAGEIEVPFTHEEIVMEQEALRRERVELIDKLVMLDGNIAYLESEQEVYTPANMNYDKMTEEEKAAGKARISAEIAEAEAEIARARKRVNMIDKQLLRMEPKV